VLCGQGLGVCMAGANRRAVLRSLAGAGLAGLGLAELTSAGAIALPAAALVALSALCAAYRRQPPGAQLPRLDAAFFAHAGWPQALQALIQQDFALGNVRLVDGWVLADHEIAASIALVEEQRHAA